MTPVLQCHHLPPVRCWDNVTHCEHTVWFAGCYAVLWLEPLTAEEKQVAEHLLDISCASSILLSTFLPYPLWSIISILLMRKQSQKWNSLLFCAPTESCIPFYRREKRRDMIFLRLHSQLANGRAGTQKTQGEWFSSHTSSSCRFRAISSHCCFPELDSDQGEPVEFIGKEKRSQLCFQLHNQPSSKITCFCIFSLAGTHLVPNPAFCTVQELIR